ncbi:CobW family GTP-binding protein [Rubritalea marina]|uniref:CobW family GTP-binding protein n=1 Tax=Rubritalea marina TaxID=361055 RepID=UPI0014614486|nr:GTP-binding protein [Rubritalea marina]
MKQLAKMIKMRPCVLISGFLGAGKTTFLRNTLKSLVEAKIEADVILNDYSNAEIDSETLRDHSSSVKALAASCACCEGMEFLNDMVVEVANSDHDILLVELNGTADPLPILESLTLLEDRFKLHPRWHVCVIDARSYGRRSHHNRLELIQLETASHYFISHHDAVDDARLAKVRAKVQERNPSAEEIDFKHFSQSVIEMASRKKRCMASSPDAASTAKAKHRPDHQLAHEFTACQFRLPEPIDPKLIEAWFKSLPESVMRAKALITPTQPGDRRLLYERIGMQMPPKPYTVSMRYKVPSSAVLIGPDLDLEALAQSARSMVGDACELVL